MLCGRRFRLCPITALLEGMRVVVGEKRCELQVYDFVSNKWVPKDTSSWPLAPDRANGWLTGWNHVDRFAAVNVLTKPPEYPVAPRATKWPGEAQL